jgi:hypothetical protein
MLAARIEIGIAKPLTDSTYASGAEEKSSQMIIFGRDSGLSSAF